MVKSRELSPKPLLDEPSMLAFLREHGVKPVHAGKIWKAALENPQRPLDELPGIPERIRAPLKQEFTLFTSKLVKTWESNIDGTIKMLIQLQDGGEVEAVLIHHLGEPEHPDRRQADRCGQRDTLCISSQLGCRLGCTFCATGTMGLQGNLWSGEILEQLAHARALRGVNNVVFMGMGEPLENFTGVQAAIRGLVDPQRFGLAPSGITVSTVGPSLHYMRRLMDEVPKIKIAFSLHAPNQELREQLLPVAKQVKIDQLMEVIDEYAEKNSNDGKRKGMIMVSYVMLEGVNDSDECAHQLVKLVGQRPVIINLIPFNSFEGDVHHYQCPPPERIDAFLKILVDADLRVFERRHHGRDIAAACGQLAKLGGGKPTPDIESVSCALSKDRARGLDHATRARVAKALQKDESLLSRPTLVTAATGIAALALSACAVMSFVRWRSNHR